MASNQRIGLRQVRALKPGEIVWDESLPGFGARRQRSKVVSYVLFYRTYEGRQRWFTIGRHGAPWTPETARAEAVRLLGEVVSKADPAADKRAARKAETVAELCDLYLADADAGRLMTRRRTAKKASTLVTDRGRIERHIKPLLGTRTVAAVTRQDIEAFLHDVAAGKTGGKTKTAKKRGLAHVRGGKGTATRTVGLLGAIFSYAIDHNMRLDNPAKRVKRYADGKRTRRLEGDEYVALGRALAQACAASIWPAAVAATRFLLLTGWRSGEALGLRWGNVDFSRRTATLSDTKTGESVRPLCHAACDLLRGLAGTSNGKKDALVFPPTRGDGHMSGFRKPWDRITELGGLPPDVTPHTLRHSFASVAAELGCPELTIAALLGHRAATMTAKYTHIGFAPLLSAADAGADKTLALMEEEYTAPSNVVPMARQIG
jgi:integrase